MIDPRFATFDPSPRRNAATDPLPFIVRGATVGDATPIAAIIQGRDGGDLARHVAGIEREIGDEPVRLMVATVHDAVVAYARCSHYEPPPEAPPNAAPKGWHLSGLAVSPRCRRRGIGLALTRARLDWLARRTTTVFYFCNARNRASIALHAGLGFVELSRDFWVPGVTFTGGEGILFRASLRRGSGRDAR